MFSNHQSHHLYTKRRRLSESTNFGALSNNKSVKKDFLLEIKGNSDCNLNKDLNVPSWIKYDLTKINKAIDLSGGLWTVGINACIITNSLNSWKKISNSNLPSSSFIKIGVKYTDKPTKLLGVKFFENRLYSKSKIISQTNMFLSAIWGKICYPDIYGTNVVGEVFSLTIFAFYLNKTNNTAHILSLSDISKSTSAKKSWNLFLKTFEAFKKGPKEKIERIEVFISKELSSYLGDFQIPSEFYE